MRFKSVAAAAAFSFAALAGNGAGAATTCLWTRQIDHTHVVDRNTVLFYMKDGKIWRNDLKSPCMGLKLHGFSFTSASDEICSNAVGIRVIRTGEVCTLGRFSPSAGPVHASY
jgi:hypothetical protein